MDFNYILLYLKSWVYFTKAETIKNILIEDFLGIANDEELKKIQLYSRINKFQKKQLEKGHLLYEIYLQTFIKLVKAAERVLQNNLQDEHRDI